ncbi:T9SS type A sorting domain-containing protein [Flavobacterium sp. 102]|uniref:T9SS type A sorting domain-containing protein n=2 Tax=unclassified Flavobacterium TaxID=196869 RepID=UPI000EB41773|nr:T9SS type A sorting domain-containing protein [Flavobacterium sp. 102]RKS01853.1 putative secreted protein (Por secretion system target) [Flavobacterium sp. 102]
MSTKFKKIKKDWLLLCFVLFSFVTSYSQAHLTYTITNFTSTTNTLSYDVYITNDGTTQIKLANLSIGINYSSLILNGSTNATGNNTNYTYEAGSRSEGLNGLNPYANVLHQYSATKNHLRFQTSSPATIDNSPVLTIGVPYKIGRFTFANAGGVNWTSQSNALLAFQGAAQGGYATTQATVYVGTNISSTTYGVGANLSFSYVNSPYLLNTCTNTSSSITETACGSYTWTAGNGQTYTESGTYTSETPIGGGCTDTKTLNLTIIQPTAPTVSLSSSDGDNTFAYGTSVTFTANAGNLGGGTASYDFKVNGVSVQNGASNTYTVSTANENNLANGNQVSVSITVTGGTCLSTPTADSNVIANTVTGAYFTNITNYCGQTLPAVGSRIKCSVPSGVVGVLGYRFKVTNNVTAMSTTVDSNVASFNMGMINSSVFAYGTSYNVQVAAIVNGVLQPYSSGVCVITTPSVPSNQVTSLCGQTLESLNTRIYASTVSGSVLYRWRVALSTAPTTYFTLTTTSSSFRLTNVPNLNVTFGKTYLVEVQSDVVINGVSFTSDYSTVCNVSTPAASTISVSANQCGQTLTTILDRIYVNSVPNAVNYTYRVQKVGSAQAYDFTTSFTSFRLNNFPSLSLTYDSEYNVSVMVQLLIDGVYYESEFSEPCIIRTPLFPTVGLQSSQCSDGNEQTPGPYQVQSNSELIYSEFVSGASYEFLLQQLVNGVPTGTPLSTTRSGNYFSLDMIDGELADTDYVVYVKLLHYGEGPVGKDCIIRTPSVATKMVVTSAFAAKAYPNPFANNFLIDLTTESQSSVSIKVYDMVGRLVESHESKASNLSSFPIGDRYPSGVYNVVVTQDEEVKTLRVIKR